MEKLGKSKKDQLQIGQALVDSWTKKDMKPHVKMILKNGSQMIVRTLIDNSVN